MAYWDAYDPFFPPRPRLQRAMTGSVMLQLVVAFIWITLALRGFYTVEVSLAAITGTVLIFLLDALLTKTPPDYEQPVLHDGPNAGVSRYRLDFGIALSIMTFAAGIIVVLTLVFDETLGAPTIDNFALIPGFLHFAYVLTIGGAGLGLVLVWVKQHFPAFAHWPVGYLDMGMTHIMISLTTACLSMLTAILLFTFQAADDPVAAWRTLLWIGVAGAVLGLGAAVSLSASAAGTSWASFVAISIMSGLIVGAAIERSGDRPDVPRVAPSDTECAPSCCGCNQLLERDYAFLRDEDTAQIPPRYRPADF